MLFTTFPFSQTFVALGAAIALWFYFAIIIESSGKLQTHESGASMKVNQIY
jgi:hypothetical protein